MINYDFTRHNMDEMLVRIKRRRSIFLSLLMFFLILILLLLLLTTDIFEIRKITVSGNKKLSYNDIVSLSGVIKGQNIFEVDRQQVKSKLEANPYIVVKSIKRKLPSELIIDISERQEAMMVEMADGYALLDESAVYLQHVAQKGQWLLPVVVGMEDVMNVPAGTNIAAISDKGKALINLISALKRYDMLADITHIDIQSEYDMIAVTDWDMQIKFGDDKNLDRKLAWVEAVLKDLKSKGQDKPVGIVDVTYADQAVYTPYFK